MKSIQNFSKLIQPLSEAEMVSTKGGAAFTISAGLDICIVNNTTGSATSVFCDRRKKRVGS